MPTSEKPVERTDEELDEKQKEKRGSRNLTILGIVSTGIAVLTTAVSLIVYHDSGDIYLDRSRPGFLPEKEEVEIGEENKQFSFSDSGKLTQEVLDEYLENLKQEINRVNDFSSDPFGTVPLSDETLGL